MIILSPLRPNTVEVADRTDNYAMQKEHGNVT
jgi:hypothetical protein